MIVKTEHVAYKIKTRSVQIKNYLDMMFLKYGINDYALSTKTAVEKGSIEIFPAEEQNHERADVNRSVKKVSDLLLEQYLRL